MHCNYRSGVAWANEKLPLTTTSDEACKLYDAAISQYVGWYDDPAIGGIEKTLERLGTADPNFVMGKVLIYGLDLLGTGRTTRLDKEFEMAVEELALSGRNGDLTQREKRHVEAIKLFADGYMNKAADIWEDILLDHPTDLLAIKFAHDTYFYLGQQNKMRDSVAKTLPSWNKNIPLYSYLHGMLAFGEVETNFYDKAMESAQLGLSLNRKDAWATHAAAHVLEMKGEPQEGIKFMSTTLDDWTFCGMLACHNFWHWALYHVEKGEPQAALDIYDSEIGKRAHSGALLDIVDMSSLLFRLELQGVNVGNRWKQAFEICAPHLEDHITTFNDVHLLFSCTGAKESQAIADFLKSIDDFHSDGVGDQHEISKQVGNPIYNAIIAYRNNDYERAVDLLYPIRYQCIDIGGSNAQRDVLNLLLIGSALNCKSDKHCKIARALLAERKSVREKSPMTDRLIARTMAHHTS